MHNRDVAELVQKAEAIYEARLQAILEPCHDDEFVVIEPESGEYFLGKTLTDAANAARAAASASTVSDLPFILRRCRS